MSGGDDGEDRRGRRALSAHERVALVADPGSLEPWDEDVVSDDPLNFADRKPYAERLRDAADRTGRSEGVLTSRVTVDGQSLVVISAEFGFLGGSIAVATGERIARAFDRATAEALPVLALTASGGSRMQEGVLALVQMTKLAAAVRRLRDAGGLYVVYLMHPTTGGVLASWASLGTVTFAMPGALIGFGGPRVVELTTGQALPRGVQSAERLYERGLVDDLVEPPGLRRRVSRLVSLASPTVRRETLRATTGPGAENGPTSAPPPREGDAWVSVQHARDPARPSAPELLAAWGGDAIALRGDGSGGGDDPGCLLALARLWGRPFVVVAQSRSPATREPARMNAAGYRKARRGMALAGELGLPLVTIIDTPGAEVSVAAEEGGVAAEIARCLSDMSAVPTATVSVLLGEGGSGGALALLPADRVVCAEHATLAVIAPEGASAILYRSVDRAPELAGSQAGASWDLWRWGIADVVVVEEPSAAREPQAFAQRLGEALRRELETLLAEDPDERRQRRRRRYRNIGTHRRDERPNR